VRGSCGDTPEEIDQRTRTSPLGSATGYTCASVATRGSGIRRAPQCRQWDRSRGTKSASSAWCAPPRGRPLSPAHPNEASDYLFVADDTSAALAQLEGVPKGNGRNKRTGRPVRGCATPAARVATGSNPPTPPTIRSQAGCYRCHLDAACVPGGLCGNFRASTFDIGLGAC